MTSQPVPTVSRPVIRRGWRERAARRLTATVGAFGVSGALMLAQCTPPPPPPSDPAALQAKPVEPPCTYRDTFGAPRSGGRTHLGTDILAASGNELYAVVTGQVTRIYTDAPGSLSGNGLRITKPDGTYFFYAHLSSLARGISVGTAVTAGQLVGYVGQTGNAGTPHLHLEIHPGGGAAVNPYPYVRATGAC